MLRTKLKVINFIIPDFTGKLTLILIYYAKDLQRRATKFKMIYNK